MKTFVVIAAFNEEKKIGEVLEKLKKAKYDVIVVDDGSGDKTYEISKRYATTLRHIINRGQGAALKTGIDYAIAQGAQIIVTFDADGQFLVEDIEKVAKPVIEKKAEIVLGSRFLGKAVNIPLLKKVVLKLGIFVVFFLYGIKITDSQSGFRALSRKAALNINITSDRMEHAGEFFYEIMKHKLKYMEVPIIVIYDKYSLGKGQSWVRSIDLGIKMLFRRMFYK